MMNHWISRSRILTNRNVSVQPLSRIRTVQQAAASGGRNECRIGFTSVRPLATSTSSSVSVLDHVMDKVKNESLIYDEAQVKASKRLSKLQEVLLSSGHDDHHIDFFQEEEKESKDESSEEESKDEEPTHSTVKKQPSPLIPRGMFLYGDVGTGKSLLMDLFYHSTPLKKKRRIHFHAFLQNIHSRVHALKQEDLKTLGRNFHIDTSLKHNPIVRVALQLSAEMKLLCLDEFQVTDVADALILSQLFGVMFQSGTVLVATSNRPPEDLYENGLNRSYFLPFLDLLRVHCVVHCMNSQLDYRRLLSSDDCDSFYFVLSESSTPSLSLSSPCDEIFHALSTTTTTTMDNNNNTTNIDDDDNVDFILPIGYDRTLSIPPSSVVLPDICCRFQFSQLCDTELGAADYRAIANQFQTVVVEDVPPLSLRQHDQARRFITLIDELYEAKCCLIMSAALLPDDLFVSLYENNNTTTTTTTTTNDDDMELKVGEMFGIDVAQSSNNMTLGELASVRELSFAFRRASSRVVEMTSKPWWSKYYADYVG